MSWNIAPECISTVMLCIIWIYSRKGNPLPSIKNRLFQICFFMTFLSMTSNIISTYVLLHLSQYTFMLAWIVNMVYFLTTPLLGLIYYLYAIANVYEDKKNIKKMAILTSVPGVIYIFMILLNPLIRNVFNITLKDGYTQERYIMVTYLIFYIYCILSVLLIVLKGKNLSGTARKILFAFPIMAAAVIIIQMFIPQIILSGSAATSALLVIYLYLQNKQISIDYLTGVANRKECLKMLELKVKKSSHARFAIIIISLCEFKVINDTYGQHNGDKLLVDVCDFLKKEFSLNEGELFRYSGDEFAILLDQCGDDIIKDNVVKISRRMEEGWEIEGGTCILSAAQGIIWYPDHTAQLQELIIGIEYTVAQAKKEKTNGNICWCNSEVLCKANRKTQITTILKDCLANDGFEVYYQPILNVKDRGFYIAEALLRINNSSLGPLSPGEFIPIAEDSGLIIDITYKVLDKVCKTIKKIEEEHLFLDGISVNFSTIQFSQKDLIDKILAISEKNLIQCSKIKIEITESTLAENTEIVTAFAYEMHSRGVKVGLDDFGTGYSNLTSVTKLPIDAVKLDKSLIWSAMENERSRIIVENLARAFDQLGMRILAEGIETPEQSKFVEGCGCSLIQGFLYAKPMPEEEFISFLKVQNKNV